jgi:glutathione S-transferase
VDRIDISKGTQKEPWFLALNPNGRIPVLIDRERGGFPVFETGAILLYLARRCDTEHKFWFDPQKREEDFSTIQQWIFWAVSLIFYAEVSKNFRTMK